MAQITDNSLSWKVSNLVWKCFGYTLPDKWYLTLRYYLIYRRWINWKEPVYFTEKLQWLKVYGKSKEYSHLVDKVKVKEFVASRVGKQYIIPTLACWDSPKYIEVTGLPTEFVLKCNHDSGSLIICKDRDKLDLELAKKNLGIVFKSDYYRTGRESPYKFVEHKVFAEELLHCASGKDLMDYKFFCFNGEPKLFKVDFNRFVDHHANYYSIDKKLLPFGEVWPPFDHSKTIDMPDNFDEMVEIARKLSTDLPFARIDLYNNDGKIYFGEITLFPTSGFGPFTDEKWDKKLGEWINLPKKNKRI